MWGRVGRVFVLPSVMCSVDHSHKLQGVRQVCIIYDLCVPNRSVACQVFSNSLLILWLFLGQRLWILFVKHFKLPLPPPSPPKNNLFITPPPKKKKKKFLYYNLMHNNYQYYASVWSPFFLWLHLLLLVLFLLAFLDSVSTCFHTHCLHRVVCSLIHIQAFLPLSSHLLSFHFVISLSKKSEMKFLTASIVKQYPNA